jgi:hypothetical protein
MPLPNDQPWTEWDFNVRVSAGREHGVYSLTKFGRNAAVGLAREDIWNAGGVLQFLSSAETMSVVSTSAADDGSPAGTGANTIIILGINDNFDPISEIVVMNGLTPVVTSNSFLRINNIRVLTAGTGGTNAGIITATASTAVTTQGQILANEGQSAKSQMTIPNGYYGILISLSVSCGALTSASVSVQTREENAAWNTRYKIDFIGVAYEESLASSLILPPHSDFRIQGIRQAAGADIIMTSFVDFYLIEESLINENIPILGF